MERRWLESRWRRSPNTARTRRGADSGGSRDRYGRMANIRCLQMRCLLAKIWNAIIIDCSTYKAHTQQFHDEWKHNCGMNAWQISRHERSISNVFILPLPCKCQLVRHHDTSFELSTYFDSKGEGVHLLSVWNAASLILYLVKCVQGCAADLNECLFPLDWDL